MVGPLKRIDPTHLDGPGWGEALLAPWLDYRITVTRCADAPPVLTLEALFSIQR